MKNLTDKTIFITGSSRGIGREIAIECGKQGANVVIAAKSAEPHPKLPGTIHTVAAEVEAAGGQALAIQLDVRDEAGVKAAMQQAVAAFGGIDVLVNNASAISLTSLQDTDIKRFDLIHEINTRGSLVCAKAAMPYLIDSKNKQQQAHIITLSPPLNMASHWLKPFIPYTMSKYGMTLLTLGLAEELREQGVSCSTLWPQTAIATAAVEFALDANLLKQSRTPKIMADAALAVISCDDMTYTGQTLVDESLLRTLGTEDFDVYKYDPSATKLMRDLYLDT